eukprot:9617491-Prorocentrum_lima.AAC.1
MRGIDDNLHEAAIEAATPQGQPRHVVQPVPTRQFIQRTNCHACATPSHARLYTGWQQAAHSRRG